MKVNAIPLAILIVTGAPISLASVAAHAATAPHSLVTGKRVKQVPYEPD